MAKHKLKDYSYLVGQRFGKLVVIEANVPIVVSTGRRSGCRVRCDCGVEKIVSTNLLTNNGVRSCGCLAHESRLQQKGKRLKLNHYDLSGEYGIGYCTNTGREFYFDLEDYDKISNYHIWECKSKSGYCRPYADSPIDKRKRPLHQIIKGKWQDHINRDPFDNRKINLRDCDNTRNIYNSGLARNNTSGVTGVTWHKQNQKWRAFIQPDRRFISLGLYNDIDNAIRARLETEKKYFGKFAPQKHLYTQYGIKEN